MARGKLEDDFRMAASLRCAIRRFEARSDRIVRRHGLTSRQYLLLLLVRSGGGKATVSSLVQDLHLGQSTVTELVQRADEQGLIARSPSSADGRVVYLSLSPEGLRRLEAAFGALGGEREHLIELVASLELATAKTG